MDIIIHKDLGTVKDITKRFTHDVYGFLSLVKKILFTIVGQIKNSLQEVGISYIKFNSQEKYSPEYIPNSEYIHNLAQDVNHWKALKKKKRKTRLVFAKTSENNILWVCETKIILYKNYGKSMEKELLMIQRIQMAWHLHVWLLL